MPRKRSIETRDNDARALELRRRGLNYAQIANEMGFKATSSAHEAVQRALADISVDAAAQIREIEAARLDDLTRTLNRVLLSKHYVVSQAGKVVDDPETEKPMIDTAPVVRTVLALVRVQERRAKLLGLDAPIKHEVRNVDAIDARLLDLAGEVGDLDTGPAPGVRREA